jgi:hypothetical protein
LRWRGETAHQAGHHIFDIRRGATVLQPEEGGGDIAQSAQIGKSNAATQSSSTKPRTRSATISRWEKSSL